MTKMPLAQAIGTLNLPGVTPQQAINQAKAIQSGFGGLPVGTGKS